jgi:hypothetical protein
VSVELNPDVETYLTHLVQVETPLGQYPGLLSDWRDGLCWLADPEDPVGRPPVACVHLGGDWAIRHLRTDCPACEAEEEEAQV